MTLVEAKLVLKEKVTVLQEESKMTRNNALQDLVEARNQADWAITFWGRFVPPWGFGTATKMASLQDTGTWQN